jgi:hypothetical protein
MLGWDSSMTGCFKVFHPPEVTLHAQEAHQLAGTDFGVESLLSLVTISVVSRCVFKSAQGNSISVTQNRMCLGPFFDIVRNPIPILGKINFMSFFFFFLRFIYLFIFMYLSTLLLSSDTPQGGISSHSRWLWATMWLPGMWTQVLWKSSQCS